MGVAAAVVFDFQARTADVRGAGAPDLRAPSAAVGRVAAERTARANAMRALRDALKAIGSDRIAAIGCGDRKAAISATERNAAKATTLAIDWGSDGSVILTLRVPLSCDRSP